MHVLNAIFDYKCSIFYGGVYVAQLAVQMYDEQRKKAKESPGGDFYKTAVSRIDQRFFRMLVGSVAEGRTLHSEAFRLTNTTRSTFHELREQAGGGF